ncbi:MAG: cupin [Candidatus Vogelbacteria bacterium CG10_big_fil_rev_8_21_14_0_10_49_38]|uniref:Cupin n=1 Tax=Candidatus Vogelbacteria bacterium CG10_big_fil_rev_8_21_14_0_10_49_38 TaxID=1975043 RepID=A0A2H0RHI7_9BACT|nr:MAG: cupin [bacterium CG10_49_38]PIR46022.1 MAG: cupin [Candidatus Vogelbacteria bacterium CG10_big_fil_rev_8_21_14_0_10_49_38]
MSGYLIDIEKKTKVNDNFREVLFTAEHSQLVVMSLLPGEAIGEETHQLDQFLRVEAGEGLVVLDGQETRVSDGSAIVVPAGVKHNLINTANDQKLKLYTVYAPPEHRDGTVHRTRAEALADENDHYL